MICTISLLFLGFHTFKFFFSALEAGSRMAQYQKENNMAVNEKMWDKIPKSMLVQVGFVYHLIGHGHVFI